MNVASPGAIEPVIGAYGIPHVPAPQKVRYRAQFTGNTAEYFRIWIVNVALSILTLGVYSAWAKVRTQRYFYSNLRLADSPFEYVAQPVQILKGRLIAYTVVFALWASAHFQVLVVYFPLLLLVVLLLPWVIHRTLRFRARYSAWRGLRFQFLGNAGDAYASYLFRPMVMPFTLYLCYPWVRMRQHEYNVSGHRFGGRRFDFAGNTNGYFGPFFAMLGIGAIAYVGFFIAMTATIASLPHPAYGEPRPPISPTAMFLPLALLYGGMLACKAFLGARYHNVMWEHARLGVHRFECTLSAGTMIWLYLTNILAIIFTLGMAIPWAMVRLARYRAEQFTVVTVGNLDHFVAETAQSEGAAGAELLGALDMNIDIGL